MKILVTGMNAPHINSDRVPLRYATGLRVIVETLKLHHEVEWRPVIPGEDLRPYHKVLVALGPPNALTAQYTYGAMWCLGRDPDTVDLVLDDHQTHQVLSGFKTVNRDHDRLWKSILNRKGRAEVEKDPSIARVIEESVETLATASPWPWRVWAPMFPAGRADPDKLGLPAKSWVVFDPTTWWYHANFRMSRHSLSAEERERVWVSASLLDKSPWLLRQRREWETICLGSKKLGQPRLKEEQVLRLYGACWGVISCPHRHAGSGWWRARYAFAALMGAVVLADHRESSLLGDSYKLSSATAVEKMSTDELRALAEAQSAELSRQAWKFDQLQEYIDREVNA